MLPRRVAIVTMIIQTAVAVQERNRRRAKEGMPCGRYSEAVIIIQATITPTPMDLRITILPTIRVAAVPLPAVLLPAVQVLREAVHR